MTSATAPSSRVIGVLLPLESAGFRPWRGPRVPSSDTRSLTGRQTTFPWPPPSLHHPNPRSSSLRFRTSGGVELVADAWGDDADPVVLLAHGGGQTRHSWGGTAAVLARHGWHAISLDLRGHGQSGWSHDGDYRFGRFAEDVAEVAAQLDRPAMVGASLGGLTGLLVEGRAGGTFRSLVLVDITPRMEPDGVERIMAFMGETMEHGFGIAGRGGGHRRRLQPAPAPDQRRPRAGEEPAPGRGRPLALALGPGVPHRHGRGPRIVAGERVPRGGRSYLAPHAAGSGSDERSGQRRNRTRVPGRRTTRRIRRRQRRRSHGGR